MLWGRRTCPQCLEILKEDTYILTHAGCIPTMSQGFKTINNCRNNSPTCPFLYFIQHLKVAIRSNSPNRTTVFHASLDSRFIEINFNLKRKKLYRVKKTSNFLSDRFSSRDNTSAPIQFRKERQCHYLQNWFFIKDRPIHYQLLEWWNEASKVFKASKYCL